MSAHERSHLLAQTHTQKCPVNILIRPTRALAQRQTPRRTNACTYSHKRTRTHTHTDTCTHAPTGSRCRVRTSALHRRATPLHYAAEKGKYDVVRLLVANGADATAKKSFGSAEYSSRRCTFCNPFGALPAARALGPAYYLGVAF